MISPAQEKIKIVKGISRTASRYLIAALSSPFPSGFATQKTPFPTPTFPFPFPSRTSPRAKTIIKLSASPSLCLFLHLAACAQTQTSWAPRACQVCNQALRALLAYYSTHVREDGRPQRP